MKQRKSHFSLWVLLFGILGGLLWQFSPIQGVYSIANLSDPAKLATLGERGANPRLNKIVYWLDQTRGKWITPETAIGLAQTFNRVKEPKASLVKESLLHNLKIADELGLLTSENKNHLRGGHAATITRGPYKGDTVEIDHVVPISLAPELGNELANLEMIPKTIKQAQNESCWR